MRRRERAAEGGADSSCLCIMAGGGDYIAAPGGPIRTLLRFAKLACLRHDIRPRPVGPSFEQVTDKKDRTPWISASKENLRWSAQPARGWARAVRSRWPGKVSTSPFSLAVARHWKPRL